MLQKMCVIYFCFDKMLFQNVCVVHIYIKKNYLIKKKEKDFPFVYANIKMSIHIVKWFFFMVKKERLYLFVVNAYM